MAVKWGGDKNRTPEESEAHAALNLARKIRYALDGVTAHLLVARQPKRVAMPLLGQSAERAKDREEEVTRSHR